MSDEHYAEILLIETSRAEREAMVLPEDTGETYDENGAIMPPHQPVKCDGF